MAASVCLQALGPVTLEQAVLLEPAPVRLGGKPWGTPRYSVRCRLTDPLPELCDAIDEAVLRQWPEGPPASLRHPIQRDDRGLWFHAGAPAVTPPEIFHRSNNGEVAAGIGPTRTLEGATALVSVDVLTYQPVPWAGGCDIVLRAVCVIEAGAPSGAAASFTAALRGIPNAA